MSRKPIIILSILSLLTLIIFVANDVLIAFESNQNSLCYGNSKNGRLENGKRLTSTGDNFSTYSYLGSMLGRTAAHDQVKDIILNSYDWLFQKAPKKVFVYGEVGWPSGGKFRPHKTHQNGTSVDFMVPLVDDSGQSVVMSTNILNKWGYNIEFDENGELNSSKIDFNAMAMHIYALKIKAEESGVKIWRVIFDPSLQKYLFQTEYGKKIRDLKFSKKRSWVRHDEHYHVDFKIKCDD